MRIIGTHKKDGFIVKKHEQFQTKSDSESHETGPILRLRTQAGIPPAPGHAAFPSTKNADGK